MECWEAVKIGCGTCDAQGLGQGREQEKFLNRVGVSLGWGSQVWS